VIQKFPPGVEEKIGYYVYLLSDPRIDRIFYVGKGKGNRVFNHVTAALESVEDTDKLEKIRAILSEGLEVDYTILRHGLTEEAAFEVESALIDYIGLKVLSNQIQGKNADDQGKMTIGEIIEKYEAPKATIIEPAIILKVNRLYHRGMTDTEIYEITRGQWVIGPDRDKAKYAFSVSNGIIRAVFEIKKWNAVATNQPHQKRSNRWEFEGEIAPELQHYVGCSVIDDDRLKAQNPVLYVNIKR